MNNPNAINQFITLANLAAELWREGEHIHSQDIPSDWCGPCWNRRMASDLWQYIHERWTPVRRRDVLTLPPIFSWTSKDESTR